MPTVSLPHDLVEQLEHSDVATINNTEGPGVASYVYLASDGVSRTRADVYIGLELDGHTVYRNISSVDPDIKMQFAVQPVVLCQSDVLTFTSNYSTVINIQVFVYQHCGVLNSHSRRSKQPLGIFKNALVTFPEYV